MSTFRPYTEIDQKIDDLHREATSYKKTDIDKAIHCLKKAKLLMKKTEGILLAQRLRLPLFLQQAGRFDEAILEFEQLLKSAIPRAEKDLAIYQEPLLIEYRVYQDFYQIYDKMRLICERENLQERSKKYSQLGEKYKIYHTELRKILDK